MIFLRGINKSILYSECGESPALQAFGLRWPRAAGRVVLALHLEYTQR